VAASASGENANAAHETRTFDHQPGGGIVAYAVTRARALGPA
jgi:hypothetical protein